MWIVRIALSRPYTFIVLAILILIASPIVILRTPTDIFPTIDIPVLASIWTYAGLNATAMEGRIVGPVERNITTVTSNIEHSESFTVNGRGIIKLFLQPGASVETAMSELTAVSQSSVRGMPPGTGPPFIFVYNASTVPIIQLALSSKSLSEAVLNDVAGNFLRTQLSTIPGVEIPGAYGGKPRQVNVSLNLQAIQSKGLSPADVVNAVSNQNVILPSGTAKIGQFEYDVDLNAVPDTVAEMNDLPIRVSGNSTIYLRDVATVSDGFAPQTNVVRLNGERGVLLSVLKHGDSSTLDIVDNVRKALPRIASTLPEDLRIAPLADQSVFVRGAIQGVVREAVIAACLTGLMVLIFLGSWRSTLIIAVSIPLSILTSICVLSAIHQTINLMTLGGLALAVGILVDDATVTIENIERFLAEGHDLHTAILEGAAQIAVPALVSTLCICIVFIPMFFLSGVARYLFVPLAEAVVFAMLASYVLSRTLVPTLAMYLLRAHHDAHARTRNPFTMLQRAFDRGFERVRLNYQLLLMTLVYRRFIVVPAFILLCCSVIPVFKWLGQDFFPSSDNGQIRLHLRNKTATRIEETARLNDEVDQVIRREIPKSELESIVDNMGLPYSGINTVYNTSGVIGTEDSDVLISLKEGSRPTADWVKHLRAVLTKDFPGTTFYFLPADMVTQILNFGLPAPFDVQVQGADLEANRRYADTLLSRLHQVPGLVDLRIQQPFDQPKLHISVDRTKALGAGFYERDVANSLLVALSGSAQALPAFFLNPVNNVQYNISTISPQYSIQSMDDLKNVPITATGVPHSQILGDLSTISRAVSPALITHYNIQRVIDLYGSVEGRDLGSAAKDVEKIVDDSRKELPRGSFVQVRGQVETMRSSYTGLLYGLMGAVVLVYLLIVVNFQSWLDPFIIISGLPAALAGIVLFLFLTNTRMSVPALMGSIMCMGVATANSILVVSFAKERLENHGDALMAAIEAGFTRFRPVLMTAFAMLIGMVPMALGQGEGGEQNAPLGRAVIGGLMCATVATLFFVPVVFSLLHNLTGPGKHRKSVHISFETTNQ